MQFDPQLIRILSQLSQHTIIKSRLYASWSTADVYQLQADDWMLYALKTPSKHTLELSSYDSLIYNYNQSYQFHLFSESLSPESFPIIPFQGKIYQLMQWQVGRIKDFSEYTEQEFELLWTSLAELHKSPMRQTISTSQSYSEHRRQYLFAENMIAIYDRIRYIHPYSLLHEILPKLTEFYLKLPFQQDYITLIHGDLASSNLILTDTSLKYIDPWIHNYGDPRIDLWSLLFDIEYAYRKAWKTDRIQAQDSVTDAYMANTTRTAMLKYRDISALYQIARLQNLPTWQELQQQHPDIITWMKSYVRSIDIDSILQE